MASGEVCGAEHCCCSSQDDVICFVLKQIFQKDLYIFALNGKYYNCDLELRFEEQQISPLKPGPTPPVAGLSFCLHVCLS